jgi:hypothetical protein
MGDGKSALSLVISGDRSQALVSRSGGTAPGPSIQVVHLPNGDIMAVPAPLEDPAATGNASLFSTDRKGDHALAELGSAYRLDIPLYDIVLQARDLHSMRDIASPYRLRWDELAIRNQVLPSGLAPAVPQEGKEAGGAARQARYFSAGPGSALIRSLATPRYRFHASASIAGKKRSTGLRGDASQSAPVSSSFLPLAPDDLFAAAAHDIDPADPEDARSCLLPDSAVRGNDRITFI